MSEQTDPREAVDQATTDHPPRGATAGIIFRMKAKSRSFEALCSMLGRLKASWRGSPSFRRGCRLSLLMVIVAVPLFAMLFWYVDGKLLFFRYTGKWRKHRVPVVGEAFVMAIRHDQKAQLCQLSPAEAVATRRWHWMETAWTDGPYIEVPGFDRPTEATIWYNATSANGEQSCTGRYWATITSTLLLNDPLGMPHVERHVSVKNIRRLERLTRPAERAGAIAVLPGECHVHAIDADRDHQLERYLVDVPAGRRLYVTAKADYSIQRPSGKPMLRYRVIRPAVKHAKEQKEGSPTPVTYLVTIESGVHEIEVERDTYPRRNPGCEDCETYLTYGFRVTWGAPPPWDDCPSNEASCELLGIANDAGRCPLPPPGLAVSPPAASTSDPPAPD